MEKKTTVIIGAVALLGVAGYFIYKIVKKPKYIIGTYVKRELPEGYVFKAPKSDARLQKVADNLNK